uniref:C-type lectin domain-containing protein n=1 Tax=Sinocyclocheilus grahami TaxID=75366 RepID=A0A672LRC3_SINGR
MSALKDFLEKSVLNLFVCFLVIGNYAGKWETTNCFKNLGYICKIRVRVVFLLWFTECFSADSHCDEGYLLFGEHCYHFETETVKNWQDAENYCVAQNGHLVSIHNQEAVSFIQAQIQSVPTGVSLWMGAHDSITEGGWMWTDGSPFRYINWASGNPDDYYNEDCLSILINSGTKCYRIQYVTHSLMSVCVVSSVCERAGCGGRKHH